jgi:AraC-like DNA-binding protein
MRLHRDGGRTSVELWLDVGEPRPVVQVTDLAVGALLGSVRALVGAGWMPLAVSFAHAPPRDPTLHHRLCGSGVRFGRTVTAVVLRAGQLDAPVVTSDPSLRPYTRDFLRRVRSPRPSTATGRAGEAVELLLPLGRCSVGQVSRELGVSARELQRRLADEGQSFSAVVDATRARHVQHHLPSDERSLTEISLMLGFAAPSAFSRWFSQRFGTTPSAWRTAARTGSPEGSEAALPVAGSTS